MQASLLIGISMRKRRRQILPGLVERASLSAGFSQFNSSCYIPWIAGSKFPEIRQCGRIVAILNSDFRQSALRPESLGIDLQCRFGARPGSVGFAGTELSFSQPFED